jgi:gluconate 2-dehydrogenase gamma chain
MKENLSRRTFVTRVVGGAGSSLLLAQFPYLAEARAHAAAQQDSQAKTFLYFTPEQAAEIEAVCEQILPSDDTPGAREAGAIFFIDYVLAKYGNEQFGDYRAAYADGLKELAAAARKHGAARFSALSSEQQVQVLKEMEKSDFFGLVRFHTVFGFLGDPRHQGNLGEVGWKYIGFDYQPMYDAPFGYYDREYTKKDGH